MNPSFNGRLIYANEDLNYEIVVGLREMGYDVLTAHEDMRANQKIADPLVLDRAILLGRIVMTNNRRHYHRLHLERPDHCGIVTLTRDEDVTALIQRIDTAIQQIPGTLDGILIRVIRPG